jgi:hypothetical protein
MVGPALPISLPKPYQSIPIAMGIEVNPPRTGGKRRRRVEGAGGLVRGWVGSGVHARGLSEALGSVTPPRGSWGCSSDIALLGFGVPSRRAHCRGPPESGISITRFLSRRTDSVLGDPVILET